MAYKVKGGKVVKNKMKAGDVIKTTTYRVTDKAGEFFGWFVVPDGMTEQESFETQHHYGPFATEQEAQESQRIELLGDQCEVREGGMWKPAWDRMQ